MAQRKLPIGIQDFEKLRTENFVYVDKTPWIYRLASESNPYFLGRPRRFGKSLLLSTLKAYFLGKRELFETLGEQPRLAIADLEKDWIEYPVFHIDLNVANYTDVTRLIDGLNANLWPLEEKWGRDLQNNTENSSAPRFLGLIRRAYEQTGKKVVILIDEYDKPLLQNMEFPSLPGEQQNAVQEEIRKELKSFYGVLKTADPWLRFVMLTGVTKFSQVSVFSDLNQLRDVSMEAAFSGVCGISESELIATFDPELRTLAEDNHLSYDETVTEMRKRYNGYHFSKESEGVYNPFSVLNTLVKRDFAYYWFQTGTPTFLINQMKVANFDPLKFDGDISIEPEAIVNYRVNSGSPVPVLYQTGYLTIKGYNRQLNELLLGFPNEEVKYGFLNALLPSYVPQAPVDQDFSVTSFIKNLYSGDVDAFMTRLTAFFASIPYELDNKTERHYQTIFYLLFTLMGQYTQAEVRSSRGRADAVVITGGPQAPGVREAVYVFEFKLADGSAGNTAEDALRQIDDKGYLIPYTAENRRLVKIGVQFDGETRTVGRWVTGE